MYRYDGFDAKFVAERAAQFRRQVTRRLAGELTEDQFRPLRLMNGLYLQLHAYMLRVNVPYGTLSSKQMRTFAHVARTYDKGFGHFTTRQNIQYNWIKLEQAPDIIKELANAEITSIQSSGNCIRNITSDQYAGCAKDELSDPRIYCELLRQYSFLHPEFSYLPRKFKIAVTGSPNDRAAVAVHDIGLRMHRNEQDEIGFEVLVGGGLGRTPYIGQTIRNWLAPEDLLSYVEAILRVYNMQGRRDNIHKARIKILVNQLGIDRFRDDVEADWEATAKDAIDLPADEIRRIMSYFAPPELAPGPIRDEALDQRRNTDPAFANWQKHNVKPHRVPGYATVVVSLKEPGRTPGDASSETMELVADLAERYGHDEIRVNYTQNLMLPHVAISDIVALYGELKAAGLATGNLVLFGLLLLCRVV